MDVDGKNNLTPTDFDLCPAWKYDEDSDLFYLVRREEDLPELVRDLSIRTQFAAPTGDSFEGYIVGLEKVFSLGLFFDRGVYHVNKKMPGASKKQVDELLLRMGKSLDFESMFPLNFETRWETEVFSNFSVVFNMQ